MKSSHHLVKFHSSPVNDNCSFHTRLIVLNVGMEHTAVVLSNNKLI